MDFAWLAGVTGFAFAMSATPGPNNTIVAASGASYGLRRSLPLLIGIAYLLWLAWKIATADLTPADAATTSGSRPLSFPQGALLQLVNPKLWVMVSGAVVTYGQVQGIQGHTVAVLFALIFGSMTFISTVGWTALGATVGRCLSSRRAMRLFNGTMAALLVLSLVPAVQG